MADTLRRGWFACVPALLALALGLWGIGAPAPWLDERFTIEAVTDGLGSHTWDAPMLPFYAVTWAWTGGGLWSDIGWLRLLSVLAAVATVLLAALTAGRIAGRRAGFAAGMLLALAPGFARYAQEARTYALAAALVMAATYVLIRLVQGAPRRVWIAYGGLLGAAALVLPITLAVVPVHAVILAGFPDWRARARDWLATCLFLVPIVALELLLSFWFAGTRTWLAKPDVSSLAQVPTMVANSEYTGVAGAAVAVLLVVLGLLTPMGARWVTGLAVAVLAVWAVSITLGSFWLPRSFIPLSGVLAVAAGLAFATVAWGRLLTVLVVVAAVTLPAHVDVRQPDSRGTDARKIADVLAAHSQSGDAIQGPAPGSPPWTLAQDFLPAWTALHYLRDDPRLVITDGPLTGRYWELVEEPTCASFQEWELTGEGPPLRLCL